MKRVLLALSMLAASLIGITSCDELDVPGEITIPDAESKAIFEHGISLSPTSEEGGLTAQVSFEASTDWSVSVDAVSKTKTVPWLSVTPPSGEAGPATITVTAQENDSEEERGATVTITCGDVDKSFDVKQAGKKPSATVKLDKEDVMLAPGQSVQLVATVEPAEAANKPVAWTSTNDRVATVKDGLVSALEEGETMIIAKVDDSEAQCKVTVVNGVIEVAEIKLDKEELTLSPGQTGQLTATVEPGDATDKTVTWTSSDETVATVDQEGKVTAVAEGEAVITAKAGEKEATCKVIVMADVVAVTSIALDAQLLTLEPGQSEVITATVKPDNATDKTVTWTSSDNSIATVENGKVTAVKEGEAIITAKAGDKTAECKVVVTKGEVAVTEITLNKAELTLEPGQSEVLVATVKPDDATDKTVTWSTSNSGVATVQNGKVTAVAEGEAVITAKAGDKTAECKVAVKYGVVVVTSVTLDVQELELVEGETGQLSATVLPDNATDKTVTWISSDESVATVDQEGKVTAVKAGEAIITAKAGDKEAQCKVVVTPAAVPVTSITLDAQLLELEEGETGQLTATVLPEDATDKSVVWFSSDESVATVDQEGKVTAVKAGEAIITAKVGELAAECKVVVHAPVVPVTEITLDQQEVHIMPDQTVQLTATVKPDNATDKTVTWSSSHPEVATVDQKGTVTGVSMGETVITATAGDKSAECLVKVEEEVPVESITLNETSLTLKEGETFQLIATLHPSTATPKPIEWVSSIPDVATVDGNGLVTAVRKGGPAMIWAIVNKGTYLETAVKCEVTVTGDGPAIESIKVNPPKVTIQVTEETVLTATVTPDGTGAEIKWFSDNTAIATVEKINETQAKVTGVGVGHVKVVASVGEIFDYCEVEVEKKAGPGVESVTLNKTNLQLGFYETFQLIATLHPDGASAEIVWTSSDEDVVLVSNGSTPAADGSIKPAGTVIAKNKEGEAVITAQAGYVAAYCTVTVTSGNQVAVESISLNKTEVSLEVGQSFQLVATILPANATNKQVSWASTAHSYELSLDVDGLNCTIGGLAACESTITVRSADNPANIYATCKVTVTGGSSGGDDEAVDLGLPSGLKWRSMNVGASKPEDYGNYYAWGETKTKATYTWENYKYKSNDYYGDGVGQSGKTVLIPEDDAATANLGDGWRTPKNKEWKELKDNCTWKWTTRNGVNGMLVTGKNGKSIFLPAAGYYRPTLTNKGTYGSYWSSSYSSAENALAWDFINSDVSAAWLDRSNGLSVRPVKD